MIKVMLTFKVPSLPCQDAHDPFQRNQLSFSFLIKPKSIALFVAFTSTCSTFGVLFYPTYLLLPAGEFFIALNIVRQQLTSYHVK